MKSLSLSSLRLSLLAALLLPLFSFTPKVQAAGITVGSGLSQGTCSLADAITAANTDTATGNCPAGDGADTITLTADISLYAALPNISSAMTIEGGGYTISGNNLRRIFTLAQGANLTLNNMTLSNGRAWNCWFYCSEANKSGGAISLGAGVLTITNTTIKNSEARRKGGAIYVAGGASLSISDSRFVNNRAAHGGAIYNSRNGWVTVTRSEFSSNKVVTRSFTLHPGAGTHYVNGWGGAIYNHGGAHHGQFSLRVSHSVFTGNTTDNFGGAIVNGGNISVDHSYFDANRAWFGGGIGNKNGLALISNSTFNANHAGEKGGGFITHRGSATLTHVTFVNNSAGNGGGIVDSYSRGHISLRNSIISGSSGKDCVGGLNQNINNYIEDGTCSPQLSSDDGAINLGELTGSPAYFPLLNGSPAINAANAAYCAETDQAGQARPYPEGGACDLGAYESRAASALYTPTPTITPTPIATATDTPTATSTATATRECAGTATEAPGAPTNLIGSFSLAGIEISWTAPEGGADGYRVSRRVHYLPGSSVIETAGLVTLGYGPTPHTETSYLDTVVVQPGRGDDRFSMHYENVAYYRYRVAAVGVDANCDPLIGNKSHWVTVHSPAGPPTATPPPADTATATSTATATATSTATATATNTASPTATNTPLVDRPAGLTAAIVDGAIILNWKKPNNHGADYQILRHRPELGETAPLVYVQFTYSSDTAYIDTAVEPGVLYVYEVKAVDFLGDGGQSSRPAEIRLPLEDNPAQPVPPTPTPTATATATPTATPTPTDTPLPLGRATDLTVSAGADGVTLSWTAPAGQVDGYEILRRRPNRGENELQTLVADTGSAATTYIDTTATEAGVRYTYRVKAIRNGQRSEWSNYARIDLPTAASTPVSLGRPTALTASAGADGVTLNWTAPAGQVDGYEILRRRPNRAESELQTLVADTGSAATAYIDTTATEAGVRYTYRVKTVRNGQRSEVSNFAAVDVLE